MTFKIGKVKCLLFLIFAINRTGVDDNGDDFPINNFMRVLLYNACAV